MPLPNELRSLLRHCTDNDRPLAEEMLYKIDPDDRELLARLVEKEEAIAPLLEILEDWERECDRAARLGYSIPLAMGEDISVPAEVLRKLREEQEDAKKLRAIVLGKSTPGAPNF